MIQIDLNTKDLDKTTKAVLDSKLLGGQLKKAVEKSDSIKLQGETVKEVVVSMVNEMKMKIAERVFEQIGNIQGELRKRAAYAVFDVIVDEIEHNPAWADELIAKMFYAPYELPMVLFITLHGHRISVNVNCKIDEDNNFTYLFNTKSGVDTEGNLLDSITETLEESGLVQRIATAAFGKEIVVKKALISILHDFFDGVDITIEGR